MLQRSVLGRAKAGALGLMTAVTTAVAGMTSGAHATPSRPGDEPVWMRVVEEDDGETLKLQLVSREYRRAGQDAPSVFLTGAVHVADASFYRQLQEFLDAKDVVLFEGVKPPGAGKLEHDAIKGDDDALAKATTRRVRFVATFVERYKREHGEYPESFDQLIEGMDGRVAKLLDGCTHDAWGRPLVLMLKKPDPAADPAPVSERKGSAWFDVVSLGADGAHGGDGADADIAFADQPALKRAELTEGEGIQRQLASALRLKFQLDAMDETKPNWRNSDLSVDQVMDRLDEGGGDGQELLSMIGGGGLMDAAIGMVAKLVGMSTTLSTMLKMVMVDMISQADQILALQEGEMAHMMKVIIEDRNEVVVRDLAGVLRNEPEIRTIGIIYGAGHLSDLADRLQKELEMEPVGETWFTAITVNVSDAGFSAAEARQMRRTMRNQIERQIKTMQRSR